MNPNWQQEFFSSRMVTDFWTKCTPPEATRADADFLEKMLADKTRLLDVPCGNGRHALELTRRGCRVTGLDISAEFIRQASAAAQAERLPAQFVHGDMREMKWAAEFDGAYCFGNSFGYFPHADVTAFLAAVARALRPGGRFVIETGMAAESLLPALKEHDWYALDDFLFIEEHRYLAESSCLETEAIFIRNGSREKRTWWHWVYTAAELRRMLEQAGLSVAHLFGSKDQEPYRLGSGVLLIVADKPTQAW
jgi:SAM-dependent methyltransferase